MVHGVVARMLLLQLLWAGWVLWVAAATSIVDAIVVAIVAAGGGTAAMGIVVVVVGGGAVVTSVRRRHIVIESGTVPVLAILLVTPLARRRRRCRRMWVLHHVRRNGRVKGHRFGRERRLVVELVRRRRRVRWPTLRKPPVHSFDGTSGGDTLPSGAVDRSWGKVRGVRLGNGACHRR